QAGGRAVQDTTSLDWTRHGATAGLGPLEQPTHYGLLVHSTLAVTCDGVPQGLLAQAVWARDPAQRGQRHRRRQRPIQAKESHKWLTALTASQVDLPPGVRLVHVGDREADVYELFGAAATPAAEPIEWLLLTTVPVTDAASAWERVTWYTYRWRVERYHLVLQSGCRSEQRQLATAPRLAACLALYSVIASRLLQLTYQARVT